MRLEGTLIACWLPLAFLVMTSSLGAATFVPGRIPAAAGNLIFCDLDGDHLKDAILCNQTNLWVCFQNSNGSFAERRRIFQAEQPCIFWATKLGRESESLLILSHQGVRELWLTNRTSAPIVRQIISQFTAVPDKTEGNRLLNLNLSLETGTDWPLLLVPTRSGLQVWKHQVQEWSSEQTLEGALDVEIWPSVRTAGYTRQVGLRFATCELNHEGRQALMVSRPGRAGATNELYVQESDGTLRLSQSVSGMGNADWQTWLCWLDINHDGRLDLIKSTWPDEPWFIPGERAGKVFVGIYLADSQGRLPDQPQQVLRKNDWNPALPVVDVDGDGFPDLVMSYSRFDSREGVRKMIATGRMDLSLKLFYYRPGSGFASEGDVQRNISFHFNLESIEMNFGKPPELQRFISLEGDFNGDGKKDLLVKEQSDEVLAYFFLSREKGFSEEPNLRFKCDEPIAELVTLDLNGDGISDLVLTLQHGNGLRIFTSTK